LQASFDKCWADARAHAAGRDDKYDVRWKEMLTNQDFRITLLKATSVAKKRNTNLALLIGGNDDKMDKETRAWYDAHRQDILRPPSTASSSPSTSTPPLRHRRPTMHRRPIPRQTRRGKEPPMCLLSSSFCFDRRIVADPIAELLGDAFV
jgi:uncharacterized protein YaaQ